MRPVIFGPIITEKSMALVKMGKFSFNVEVSADKEAIKKAIQTHFSVDVTGVDTIIQKGGSKRVGVRRAEKTNAPTKKAIVTLKSGQKIDIFDLGV